MRLTKFELYYVGFMLLCIGFIVGVEIGRQAL